MLRLRSEHFVYYNCKSADDVLSITGDNKLFVSGDDKYLYLGIGGRDHDILAALGVCLIIDGNTEIAEVLCNGLTGGLGILADACGEHDSVNAVHCGNIRACDLCDPVVEHIECELSALVALCGGIVKITEVGGNAGYAENAGLLVEDIEHLIYADTVLVHDKLDNTCVEIAAASAHRQTYQRSEAHGCVNTLAAVDCGDRAAVAHVAGDDLKLLDGLAHQLCAAAGDIAVARAVEAVAADAVVLIILIRNSVHEGLAGHGLMESGVENCDHGDIAHDITAGIDADDVCGIVQGGKGGALLESLHDLVCDEDGGSKLLTAVNDTVAVCVHLLQGADNALLCTG